MVWVVFKVLFLSPFCEILILVYGGKMAQIFLVFSLHFSLYYSYNFLRSDGYVNVAGNFKSQS